MFLQAREELDHADQCVGRCMSIRTEMLGNEKSRRTLVNASEVFTKTFPQSAPGLADVNNRAATTRDAEYQTRGQTREGIFNC